tara:strand:- start:257 stop:376 length:120 start_codon:yes stop_codon:yes gene_type:complete
MGVIGWMITATLILKFNHGCKLADKASVKDGEVQAVQKE